MIRRAARNLVQLYRRLTIRALQGVVIDPTCELGPGVRLRHIQNRSGRGSIALGRRCQLRDQVIVETWGGDIRLGDDVFIGPFSVLYGHGGVHIGSGTLVSMHCRILSSNHSLPARGARIRELPDVLLPTRIGQGVWLGAGVTVLGGVTIGDGAVIAAGAVVNRDVPPHSLWAGVPARHVRHLGDSQPC